MIRHLTEFAPDAELWGVDISSTHIRWCAEHLSPRIHFAVTTLVPHLPFGDRFFDIIFCGSVFTHIEEIQETWLLELGRVLRAGGCLYITIHDENTVRLLDTKYRDHWLSKAMNEHPMYAANKEAFDLLVIGRGPDSQVFYNSSYFRSLCPPVFRWVSLTHEAYSYQSAVVLEKVS
jgi:ubiquinone/menaquinone biosynthesis C-methylase UbiE